MSGPQWNQTDFNATLSLLMRDYATFPFFNVRVGRDPNEVALGTTKRYIQASETTSGGDVPALTLCFLLGF